MERTLTVNVTASGTSVVLLTRSERLELGPNAALEKIKHSRNVSRPLRPTLCTVSGPFIPPPTRVSPHLAAVEATTCCVLRLHAGVYRPSALTLVLNSMGRNLQADFIS